MATEDDLESPPVLTNNGQEFPKRWFSIIAAVLLCTSFGIGLLLENWGKRAQAPWVVLGGGLVAYCIWMFPYFRRFVRECQNVTQTVPPASTSELLKAARPTAELVESEELLRTLEVRTPSGFFVIQYGPNQYGWHDVVVNGVLAQRIVTTFWFARRFEFPLGPHRAVIEVRVWWLVVWFLRAFRLEVDGETLYAEEHGDRVRIRGPSEAGPAITAPSHACETPLRSCGQACPTANLRRAEGLQRILEVQTSTGPFVVEYQPGGWGFEEVRVNGEVAIRKTSILWFVPRFEFPLGPHQAVIEVRVWLWLAMRAFRLEVDGETLYAEANGKMVAAEGIR